METSWFRLNLIELVIVIDYLKSKLNIWLPLRSFDKYLFCRLLDYPLKISLFCLIVSHFIELLINTFLIFQWSPCFILVISFDIFEKLGVFLIYYCGDLRCFLSFLINRWKPPCSAGNFRNNLWRSPCSFEDLPNFFWNIGIPSNYSFWRLLDFYETNC